MTGRAETLTLPFEQLLGIDQRALVGRIAAGILHEIANPLSVVLGYAEAMKSDFLDARGRPAEALMADLDVIEDHANRCRLIMQDFLEFVRPLPARPASESLSLLALTRSAATMLAYPARCAQTRIIVDEQASSPESELRIEGARGWLLYALVELLQNAIAATDHGEVRVQLKATASNVIVSIADSGAGVPERDRAKVFEPFYTTREQGTGLGLPLVEAICAAHGGTFELDSTPAAGTTARVLLPKDSELCSPALRELNYKSVAVT